MNEATTVSILIPIRNERARLPALLRSLADQDYTGPLEVVLIDGVSEDGTRELLAEHCRRDPRCRLVDNPARVVTHALNLGLAQVTGDVIIRLDAHAEYASDYVSQCLAVLEETGAGNVGGPAVPASDGSFLGDVILAIHESAFGMGAAKFRQEGAEGFVETVWPGAYRREALEAAGRYYEEGLTRSEDLEMNSRLRAAGWKIYLSPKIKARYHPRRSLGGLLKQNFGNGVGVMQMLKTGLRGVALRHLVPFGFVVALSGLGASGAFCWLGRCALLGLLGLYAVADLAFSLRAARALGARLLLLLPAAFLFLHLAYGLGSLWGLGAAPPAPRRPV